MFTSYHYLQSMVDVVVLWVAAVAAFLAATWCLARRGRTLLRLVRGQRGVSYTLSVVVVMPFYVLLIGTVIECTMMMVVKLGTMHSAFAAARAAAVWWPAEIGPRKRMTMIHLAAGQGITPYASGREVHQRGLRLAWTDAAADHHRYHQAMDALNAVSLPDGYLQRKRRYALAATRVQIDIDQWRRVDRLESPDGRVVIRFVGERPRPGPIEARCRLTVTVTYDKPIDLPGVGRFLGSAAPWGSSYYTRPIATTVRLQLEGPKSTDQTLGIRYDSWNY